MTLALRGAFACLQFRCPVQLIEGAFSTDCKAHEYLRKLETCFDMCVSTPPALFVLSGFSVCLLRVV